MQFETITYNDLDEISRLQPKGWPDIVPEFEFYINSGFCHPVKTKINNKIVGIGASMFFDDTGWIAHIIVSKEHRNKGIGYKIVCELWKHFKDNATKTCLLIATPLGESVYLKAGFRIVTPYSFLKREKPWNTFPVSKNVVVFKGEYREKIMRLDKEVSGENRELLLSSYLSNAMVYIANNEVKGYYIPGPGEGLIVADTTTAGLELMKIKYAAADKAVLPSDNIEGLNFLKQNGFVTAGKQGMRMIRGNEINWKPEKIYSRIGGNFG